MNLKQRGQDICANFSQAMRVYFKSFYHPGLYRDVAYREEGYGLKRILWTLAGLIFVSYLLIGSQLIYQYEHEFKQRLISLPNFEIEHNKLEIFNQSLASTRMLDSKYFQWISGTNTKDIFQLHASQKIVLNSDFLWFPFLGKRYFGYCFYVSGNYFPVLPWLVFKNFVNGKILVAHLHWYKFLFTLFMFSIPVFIFDGFFVVLFIRMFAYIAKNMVVLALREALDYRLTCRLLSLSAMPTMSFMAMIINIWGLNQYTKFYFMVIYMFYYYLSLRMIRAKSYFKWMST